MEITEFRRRPDGSIDFDFYRARARTLRLQALRAAFRPKAVLKLALAAMGTLMILMSGEYDATL